MPDNNDSAISLFPRDLDVCNQVVSMSVGFLMQNLQSKDPVDLNTVCCYIISITISCKLRGFFFVGSG